MMRGVLLPGQRRVELKEFDIPQPGGRFLKEIFARFARFARFPLYDSYFARQDLFFNLSLF